jgi:hypothetical protein
MNKRNWISVVGALFLGTLVFLAGCSGEKEEKGVMEQASDKVAKKAVDYINKPLDKAKESQAMQNAQTHDMKNMLDEDKDEDDTETEN